MVVMLIAFFVRQTAQYQAPKVAAVGDVAGVDVAVSNAPADLETAQITFDTCPPGKNGDISLNDINSKPEPTVFDENNTNPGGTLGLVMEADASNETTPPTDFRVNSLQNGYVQGSWTHNGIIFKYFNVYLKVENGGWTKIGKIERSQSKQYSFVDQTVRNTGKFAYAVSVVAANNKESDCSAPAEINFDKQP